MTMSETVNLIHGLQKLGLTDSQIVKLLEYVVSANPEILKSLEATNNTNNK